jgi:hypothetical protein
MLTSRGLSPLARVLTYGTCVGLSKVLKGCVREVFKVMAQVDHDLTTINCVDQQPRVIKPWDVTTTESVSGGNQPTNANYGNSDLRCRI